ncbi:MAG: hopanoid biosynthesis associated radical SAM protein HpnH, partial [Acidobacteriota bacterium]
FEATAVEDTFKHPLKALTATVRGIDTQGPMAPEIPLDKQRPAQYVFSRHVEQKLEEIRKTAPKKQTASPTKREAPVAQAN